MRRNWLIFLSSYSVSLSEEVGRKPTQEPTFFHGSG
jgi:hypothetical protein